VSQQFQLKPWLLFVRFEQARGRGGVPKTWVPYLASGEKKPEAVTLVRMAVGLFRAQCADPELGHGKDLMPGSDDEYELHNVDGGRITTADEIKWEVVDGVNRAETVLTWRDPSMLLMEATK
jgi:hypothetical protein